MYHNVTLLQCEYCNMTNPPNVRRCQYCGASLTKAPFSYETTPPWIRKKERLGRFRCPHCNATYSYDAANFENDDKIKCQNCMKLFLLRFHLLSGKNQLLNHTSILMFESILVLKRSIIQLMSSLEHVFEEPLQ